MVRGRAIAPYTKANVLLACLQRPVWTSVELGAAVGLCASSVKAVLQERMFNPYNATCTVELFSRGA